MSLGAAANKFWRPAAVAAVTAYGSYGAYQWKQAKSVLNLDGLNKEQLSDVFDKIDTDNNGYVDIKDLNEVLNKSSQRRFSEGDVRAMIAAADVSHDGKLSKEDFVSVCEKATSSSVSSHALLPPSEVAKLTHVDEKHLKVEYGGAPPHEHKHPLTPSQLHDEVKQANSIKGVKK